MHLCNYVRVINQTDHKSSRYVQTQRPMRILKQSITYQVCKRQF